MGKVKYIWTFAIIIVAISSCRTDWSSNRQNVFSCSFFSILETNEWELIYIADSNAKKHYFPKEPDYLTRFVRQGCIVQNDTGYVWGNVVVCTDEKNFRDKYYCQLKKASYKIDTCTSKVKFSWFSLEESSVNIGYYDTHLALLLYAFLNGSGDYNFQRDTLFIESRNPYYNNEIPIKAAFIKNE